MEKEKKNKLIIIGASGHGKVVADIALKLNKWKEIFFLDDQEIADCPLDLKILGKFEGYKDYINEAQFFVAIGNNKTREKLYSILKEFGAELPALVHPHAVLGSQVKVGRGTVIMGGVVINCDTEIGEGCIINTSATVDHDNKINDFSHISPGANLAGTVKLGKNSWIGIGSRIINNINICNDCTVGAGAVVIEDLTTSGTYVGVPARKIKNG